MSDTRTLLNQLRLERADSAPARTGKYRRHLLILMIAGMTGIAGVSIGLYKVWHGSTTRATMALAESPATNPSADKIRAMAPDAPAADAEANAVLNASGYIVARRQATVSAKLTARVTEVLIDEGQHVKAGEVIARLDDTNVRATYTRDSAQLGQAEATQRAAQTALTNERTLYARMERLRDLGVVTQQDFDIAKGKYEATQSTLDVAAQTVAVATATLAITQRNIDDTVVRAPFAGIVTVKAAQPGEMVSPISAGGGFTRTGICTIVDMTSLEVDVDVSESFINRVVAGQPTAIRLNAYPDWSIPGRVITVVPTADRGKATVKVRIALGVSDARILPDMGARVSFLRNESNRATSH